MIYQNKSYYPNIHMHKNLHKIYLFTILITYQTKGSRSEGGPDRDRSNWLTIDGSNSGSKNINDLLDRER